MVLREHLNNRALNHIRHLKLNQHIVQAFVDPLVGLLRIGGGQQHVVNNLFLFPTTFFLQRVGHLTLIPHVGIFVVKYVRQVTLGYIVDVKLAANYAAQLLVDTRFSFGKR